MRFILIILITILISLGCNSSENSDYTIGEIIEYPTHRQIEIRWKNDSAILSGTLYLPSKIGFYPLAIWSHGSSANRRLPFKFKDHELFPHLSALTWIERGYAFFSYDKRGSGNSSGGFEGKGLLDEEIFNILVSDAISAYDICTKVDEIDSNFIGFFGGSMAGFVIPKAALQIDKLAFAIIINGPVAPSWAIDYYGDLTGNNYTNFYNINCEKPDLDPIYTIIDSLMLESPQYDTIINPKVDLIKIQTPSFFIQGLQDLSQPARNTVSELRNIKKKYNKNWRILVYENADHALTTNGALCVLKQQKPLNPKEHASVNWVPTVFNWLDSLKISYKAL